jgi:hypothetical protein
MAQASRQSAALTREPPNAEPFDPATRPPQARRCQAVGTANRRPRVDCRERSTDRFIAGSLRILYVAFRYLIVWTVPQVNQRRPGHPPPRGSTFRLSLSHGIGRCPHDRLAPHEAMGWSGPGFRQPQPNNERRVFSATSRPTRGAPANMSRTCPPGQQRSYVTHGPDATLAPIIGYKINRKRLRWTVNHAAMNRRYLPKHPSLLPIWRDQQKFVAARPASCCAAHRPANEQHWIRSSSDTISNVLDMPKGSIGPTRGRCLNKLRILLRHDPRWDSE